ncbi:MAG: Ig-like domain-containing protein [Lentimicrobium sp.]|jgi:hypothetical protein|nr:Ig-like domain-containing protein [Lentimicrobium sp.]
MKKLFLTLLFAGASFAFAQAQNQAPVALPDSVVVMDQVPTLIDVMANDYDPDGDEIFISFVAPLLGEARIENEMIYYKCAGYSEDQIRYRIEDNGNPPLTSNQELVYVNILVNPDVPVALPDTFELVELQTHNLNLLANDYDPNGDEIKIMEIFSPLNCTVQINPDSTSVTFTSNLGAKSYFSYYIQETTTEERYRSRRVKVVITNTPNPDMPIITPDTAYTTGGFAIIIPVLENDMHPEGDPIEIRSYTQATNGSVHQVEDALLYTPQLSFSGVDVFKYSIRKTDDPGIYTRDATVTVYVTKNPDCPVGVPDVASGVTAMPILIDVLANDYDINGDSLILKDVSAGSITADNKILFQSSPLSLVKDSLLYRVREANNPESYSEWTKVNIQLSLNPDLPVAVEDYATTRAGIPLIIKPLTNDIKNAADTLIIRFVGCDTRFGEAWLQHDSVFYVPAFQTHGIQEIKYFITDTVYTSYPPLAIGKIFVNVVNQKYYDSLVVNNINAGVNANGALFSKQFRLPGSGYAYINNFLEPHYRFPTGSQTNTIFLSTLFIGGLDESGALHMCSERYTIEGKDIQAGPISNVYDTTHYLKFGRTWKVSKGDIQNHLQNFWKPGYEPAEAILNWPGNGNTELGEALQLAPYKDYNNDGFYNCLDGDYPLIRGDECIFFMYNDDLEHTESNGLPVKVEVHGMVYGFDSPADTALYHTVFVHYDMINRSDNTYHNCMVGSFTDTDLGFPDDDFVGSDVGRASYYVYNGYDIDGGGQYYAYGENPPAQAVTVLAGPFMDEDGTDNPSGGCDESVNGLNFGNGIIDDERHGLSFFSNLNTYYGYPIFFPTPLVASDYYNYLTGHWNDSSSFMYGGGGHPAYDAVGPACRFFYPGDSDPLNWGTWCQLPEGGYNQGNRFWTESEANRHPSDRRGLGSMGPFTFSPGQVQEVDLAFVTGQGNAGVASSLNQMFRNIDSLRAATALGKLIVPNVQLGLEPVKPTSSLKIYPNPASTVITLEGLPNHTGAEYVIYNLQGMSVAVGRLLPSSRPEINVASLKSGMYLIRFTTVETVFSGKFVRN